jgi:hypothetical protein
VIDMATLALVLLSLALFVALGRSATPPDQRVPVMTMTLRDITRTAGLGVARLNQLHRRRWPSPWDTGDGS